ncbi:MAG TPA: hypothetical protein DHN33_09910, partial [Eubacteriaceae bacterium]|nr:hypothetical protein [Eubacteriaceae bacterium]
MKKTTILVVIFILGLLGASCSKADSPVVEWQRYMEAWNNENYEEMHLHLSEKSKGQRSVVDFEAVHEEFKEKMKAEQVSIKLSESFDEESIAEAIEEEEKIILPFEGEINSEYGRFTYQGESSWVYEDEEDRWMLEWDTGYLYTDYEESDRVETYYEMPQRGAILDSKGEMLAGSDKAVEIGIVPGRFTENKETVIAELAAAFELMQEQIEERLNLSWVEDDSFVDLLVVRYEELDTIEEIHEKSTAATYRIVQGRTYPKKDPFAHLVGYLGYPSEEEIEKLEEEGFSADHKVGRVGLEQAYEEQLRGLPGRKIQLESKDGEQRELLLEEQVQDGKDVKTTIRSDLQEQLYQALDGEQSAGSVIDHQTGEILALVSTPAYDNNEFSLGMSSERFQTLQNRSDAPLRNRFANTYSPGSTMKGITGAIGLDGGFIDKNFTIDVNGKEWQKDGSWGGYHVTRVTDPGRPINIEEAYIYSDNIFFAQTALRIGAETFIDRAKDFGIGRPLQTAYQWRTSQLANGQSIDKEVL